MSVKKYLDADGTQYLVTKIKNTFASKSNSPIVLITSNLIKDDLFNQTISIVASSSLSNYDYLYVEVVTNADIVASPIMNKTSLSSFPYTFSYRDINDDAWYFKALISSSYLKLQCYNFPDNLYVREVNVYGLKQQ